jgi:hypothetical protein
MLLFGVAAFFVGQERRSFERLHQFCSVASSGTGVSNENVFPTLAAPGCLQLNTWAKLNRNTVHIVFIKEA